MITYSIMKVPRRKSLYLMRQVDNGPIQAVARFVDEAMAHQFAQEIVVQQPPAKALGEKEVPRA